MEVDACQPKQESETSAQRETTEAPDVTMESAEEIPTSAGSKDVTMKDLDKQEDDGDAVMAAVDPVPEDKVVQEEMPESTPVTRRWRNRSSAMVFVTALSGLSRRPRQISWMA